MKGKDEIADLFKEGLKNFESKVDPSVWSGVQSGLNAAGGAASGGSAASSSLGKLSVLSKTIVGITAATAISVGTYFAVNTESSEKSSDQVVENVTEDVKESIQEELSQNEEKNTGDNKSDSNQKKENNESYNDSENIEDDVRVDESVGNNESYEDTQNQSNSHTTNNNSGSASENSTNTSTNPNSSTEEEVNPNEEVEDSEKNEEIKEVELLVDLLKHENQFIELSVDAKNADEIVWEMGDGTILYGNRVQHYYEEPGDYKVEVFASNEISEKYDDLAIKVEKKGEIKRLPNVFTPNKRGRFDKFFIESEGIDEFNLTIFNNKQEIVYQTDDSSFEWDGMHWKKHTPVESGDYFYVIIAKDAAGNTINKHEGLEIKNSK